MKKILLLSLFSIIFLACDKSEFEPAAAFTYQINDEGEVEFKSTSSNASYHWYSLDGTKRNTPNFVYNFPKNGKYTVTLTISNSDGKESVYSQVINITNVSGSAMFYKGAPISGLDVDVWVDKKYYGKIKGQYYYIEVPNCGNENSANFSKLSPGNHTFMYYIGPRGEGGSFIVESGLCSSFKILR